jgi:undecaprenyl-diphosphatase
MTLLQALVMGIVEGLTEFLPVSSTGHLILAARLLGIPPTDFQKSFEIAIQLGAIGAAAALYWRSFLNREILAKVMVAFVPTGVIGLALYPFVKNYLLGSEAVVLWALAIGGAILIVFELLYYEPAGAVSDLAGISYRDAFCIGLFQALAIVPGVSRSGATIVGGLALGLKRETIVVFSFLLAVPTMLAATGLDLIKNASSFSIEQFHVLACGFVSSFVVAMLSIKFLLAYVRTRTFIPFGVYRIAVALLFVFLIG